jgi:hypothetical protein
MHELVADQGKQTAKLEHIVATVNEINSSLKGNGKPGLLIRTDRLEQKEKIKARIFWGLFLATIGLLVKAVSPAFGGLFNR